MRQHNEQAGTFYRYAHEGAGDFRFYTPAVIEPRQERRISQPFDWDERLSDVPAGVPPRRRFRRFAWRFIGTLAIGGTFYGCVRIGTNAQARDAMLDWLTLGQTAHMRSIGRTVHHVIGTLVD